MKHGKRYQGVLEKVDRNRLYPVDEALALLKQTSTANFAETAEAAFRLRVDPRRNEHRIRGTVTLPHGTGKPIRVLAFAKGEALREAEEAGADHVGGEDLVKKIEEEDWLEFDRVVTTPEMMSVVSRLGRILGPRGLMPSPKTGTVTDEIGQAVREIKQGRLEFRLDQHGQILAPFGRVSMSTEQLLDNFMALAAAIVEERPADVKGRYLLGAAVSSTMGPGIKVDPQEVARRVEERRL